MRMRPTHPAFNHVIAFEVSKHSLVVHTLPADRQSTIANTPAAVRRLLKAEVRHNAKAGLGPLLVICEATGGYEASVLEAAVALGLPMHRAHGARVRHFARDLGLMAKTDAIDARLIARYGCETQGLRLYVPPTPEETSLKHLKASNI